MTATNHFDPMEGFADFPETGPTGDKPYGMVGDREYGSEASAQTRQCSKGWADRCARSKGKRCKCQCGGHNHGNPKANKNDDCMKLTCAAFDVFGLEALRRMQAERGNTDCRWCQADLNLPTYGAAHDGGWNVPGMGTMWLYLHCDKCGYDWALWKLGLPRDWRP